MGSTSVPSGCRAKPRRTRRPVSASRTTTLQDWVEESTPATRGIWWSALELAIAEAGGLTDVEAMSVGGQQHGMVVLDSDGEVIRPALLWNDTRSAEAAEQLVVELGDGDRAVGAQRWADAVGTVPVAALTVTKLRWLADHEPDHAAAVAAVALPHDWLTWKLSGAWALDTLATDRSDASGTGYFDPVANEYRRDLLALALRRTASEIAHIVLPRVLSLIHI